MRHWLLCLLLFYMFSNEHVFSQRVDPPPPHLTKSLDSVAAMLDPESGRFSVVHTDGRTILFRGQPALTSHISVKIGARIYSNYRWVVFNTDPRISKLGKGTPEVMTDRLRYRWSINSPEGSCIVIQDLIPFREGNWNEVRVSITVENISQVKKDIGIAIVLDVDAAGNDNAPILLGTERVEYERTFRGATIPEYWEVDDRAFLPARIAGRLSGNGVTKPDVVIPGRWTSHGRLGTAVYGYETSGQYIWDTAIFLQWDETQTAPGAKREATAAVGLRGQNGSTKDDTPNGTFAREIWKNIDGAYILVSDHTVSVTITSFCDAQWESEATRDDRWDTTVVLQPDVPTRIVYWSECNLSRLKTDSVRWYQFRVVRFIGDKPFAVTSSIVDVSPLGNWSADTSFLLPGDYSGSSWNICTMSEETEFSVTPKNKALQISNLQPFVSSLRMKPDSTYVWKMPPHSLQNIRIAIDETGYGIYIHPPAAPDGSGSLLKTDKPVLVSQWLGADLINARNIQYSDRPSRHFHLIPGRLLGLQYPFIPYKKTNAIRNHDFVRIVAHHDSTRLKLFEYSTPLLLNRGQNLDTLLDAPTVIEADKPFALYQHGLTAWMVSIVDSVRYADSWQHLAPEHWGRKYYPMTNFYKQYSDSGTWPPMDTSHFFLRIVAHKDSTDGITLDGIPLSPAQFLSVGNYLYADIPYQRYYGLVLSQHRFLALVYGWSKLKSIPSFVRVYPETRVPPFKE